jgi:hypothetical protein
MSMSAAPSPAVDLEAFRVHLVADPRVDDERHVGAHHERSQPEQDPVLLVGRRSTLPQRLRHDAEHRPAIQAEVPVEKRNEFEVAEFHARWTNSTSTPCVLDG